MNFGSQELPRTPERDANGVARFVRYDAWFRARSRPWPMAIAFPTGDVLESPKSYQAPGWAPCFMAAAQPIREVMHVMKRLPARLLAVLLRRWRGFLPIPIETSAGQWPAR
jgi:hypothetical protein